MVICAGSAYSQTTEEYIKLNEGLRLSSYIDRDHYAIGYGHRLEYGTNLIISKATAELWLKEDISACKVNISKHYPWMSTLKPSAKKVMVDMCINLGFNGLSKFKWMIKGLYAEAYREAAMELMDSKYARQLPGRASRNFDLLVRQHDNVIALDVNK